MRSNGLFNYSKITSNFNISYIWYEAYLSTIKNYPQLCQEFMKKHKRLLHLSLSIIAKKKNALLFIILHLVLCLACCCIRNPYHIGTGLQKTCLFIEDFTRMSSNKFGGVFFSIYCKIFSLFCSTNFWIMINELFIIASGRVIFSCLYYRALKIWSTKANEYLIKPIYETIKWNWWSCDH